MTTREELQAKYRAERDKRIRPEGAGQYIAPTGKFAELFADTYAEPAARDAVTDDVEVAIVGAGFSGLVTGARLKQAGVSDVRLIDRAGDVGGVWYWNRYPGAMCDTAAMVYLPLLEETGTMPSAKYVPGYEIFAHAQKIATTFSLYENALLSTGINSITWEEDIKRWRFLTDRGDNFTAKFIALGTGPIAKPHLPGIPGLEEFQGEMFHTSRWNYDYTGGDRYGAQMTNLGDKKVGIVGTGATGIQCVPPLARSAGELFVFQRTPSSIDVRNNHAIDPEWFKTLPSGWQGEWLMNFTTLQTGGFTDEDLVKDGWTDISQRIRDRVVALVTERGEYTLEIQQEAYEASDDEKMEEIRARVDAIVQDDETAEHLKPWYRQLCKRPCFHDEYLQAYNTPSVHLVDTDGQGVERIDATGAWVNGVHYELDCLVLASGFEVGNAHTKESGFPIRGRHELLTERWSNGMETLHGLHVNGFPNMFIIGISQAANLVSNIPHNFLEAGATIASIVRHAHDTGAATTEAEPEAQAAWVALIESAGRSFFGNTECTPGYYNNEGKEMERKDHMNSAGYPEGAVAYFNLMQQWRASGEFEGIHFA